LEIDMNKPLASADASILQSSRYAPRWITFASRILDGLFDGTRSRADDLVTQRIMLSSLQALAKGLALSEKQKAAFIDNIRVRLGETRFAWSGPIQLTRSQVRGAQHLLMRLCTETIQRSDAGIEQDLRATVESLEARLAELEGNVAQLLRLSSVNAAAMLSSSCTKAAERGPELLETQAFSAATKRNETKRNHDGAMNFPLEPMTATSGRQPAANDISSSMAETTERDDGMEGGKRRDFSDRVVVSYFRNEPDAEPSANLEFGGERFSLVFHSADVAEERLHACSSPEWRSGFDEALGASLRQQSRANARSDLRYVMSPLYDEKDRFGRRSPIANDCVAFLTWTNELQPQSVTIVHGDSATIVPLAPTRQTKPKSPTHKGTVLLAA
jgi:hypothetical protein